MEQSVKEEGKTMAIISYITFIGLIIAYFMNNSKNNAFTQFHIGQSVRILILAIVLNIVLKVLISITSMGFLSFIGFLPLALMIIGAINAMNLKTDPLPLIGTIGAK